MPDSKDDSTAKTSVQLFSGGVVAALMLAFLAQSGELDFLQEVGIAVTSSPGQAALQSASATPPAVGTLDVESRLPRIREEFQEARAAHVAAVEQNNSNNRVGFTVLNHAPIYRMNLRHLGADVPALKKEIVKLVLERYYKLMDQQKAEVLTTEDNSAAEMDRELLYQMASDVDNILDRGGNLTGLGYLPNLRMMDIKDPTRFELMRQLGESEEDLEAAQEKSELHDLAVETSEVGDTSKLNDAFFAWQSEEGGWKKLYAQQPAIKKLQHFWAMAVDNWLRALGQPPIFDTEFHSGKKAPEFFAWATVHKECVFHGAHTHGEDTMSGVYYVQIPNGAGRITFYDPRGVRTPPFDNKFTVSPREGDVVMFPSYLLHQVHPTASDTERIAIAFNVPARDEMGQGNDRVPPEFLTTPYEMPMEPPPPLDEYGFNATSLRLVDGAASALAAIVTGPVLSEMGI